MNNIYSAVKAIIQQGEKFLVIKQKINDQTFWDFPGGRIEYGESPYDTLIREVKEEVGLSINIIKPIGMFWFFRLIDEGQVMATTFLCSADNYDIDLTKNPADENILEYRWVTKDEFLNDTYHVSHDSMKKLFKLL